MTTDTQTVLTSPRRQADAFADTDCILITGAGIEALTSAEVVPDTEEENADAFTPDTSEKVNWVLGKIADRRAAAARIRENAELMARAEDREAEALEWRFGPALQAFARQELAGGAKKSIRLYNGVLGYRTKPAAAVVDDDAAALAWAREHLPEAVQERIDKKALADALLSNGEALDFARLLPAEETFYIK